MENNKTVNQNNFIAKGYKKEITEMVEKQIDNSDIKFLRQTHTIIKCHIAKRAHE